MLKTIDQILVLTGVLVVTLITLFIPTQAGTWGAIITNQIIPLLSLIIGLVYMLFKGTAVNIEAKTELARAEASKAQAQLQLARSQGRGTAVEGNSASNYTYTDKDVDIILAEAKADIQSGGQAIDKLNTSMYNYTHMANYDLRPVAREDRVELSQKFLEKEIELLDEAWIWKTNIETPPTPKQAANKTTNMYFFKKEWEKANGLKCGDSAYDFMSSLLGYYNNSYSALAGIETLIGKTVDWSVFGGGMYSPTTVGWEAANLVV